MKFNRTTNRTYNSTISFSRLLKFNSRPSLMTKTNYLKFINQLDLLNQKKGELLF